MQLTDREIKIIYLLLNQDKAITVQKLSEVYSVSVRTIKYDFKDIRDWLCSENLQVFETKPHVGVWLKGDGKVKEIIRKRLLGQTGFEYCPAPKKRSLQIVFLLSLTDQSVTLQQLENKLHVSETTILNDLERVRNKLSNFNIRLVHKDFYGYQLDGNEFNLRSYLESSLQEVISNFDIYSVIHLLQLNSEEVTGLLLGLNVEFEYIFKRVLIQTGKLIEKSSADLDYNDILTISCRLAIAIARLSINHPINSYQELSVNESTLDSFDTELFQNMFDEYDFPLYQDEYLYVINGGQGLQEDNNLAGITKRIIDAVSKKIDLPFYEDKQLFDSLLSHLISKLNGKYKFTNEYNPFVNDIKQNYPKLFSALYDVCTREVSNNPAIVNDSFVSFLALHFMVSEQRIQTHERKVRVVYVCSTGLGVTNLIQQKIEENIPNIEIAGFTSFIAAKCQINKIKPDLVISIFDLKGINSPLIQVNPLPTDSDIAKIRNTIAEILTKNSDGIQLESRQNILPNSLKKNLTLKNFSKDLIMTMFAVYEDLYKLLKKSIPDDYRDAFMLHVFMVVHRIKFNEEYQEENDNPTTDDKLKKKIKEIFQKNQLNINESEINAIIEYTYLPSGRE